MLYLILKASISGVIIAIVSEVAKRSPGAGALVASLPLVSILATTSSSDFANCAMRRFARRLRA